MYRIDHCENLIHFTKGSDKSLDYEKAYENLKKIVSEQTIVGSTGMILGKLKCVCFTESPVRCLTNSGQLDTHYFSRYTPFGIQLPKKTVFNFGGRPAIYSLRSEYEHIKQIDFVSHHKTQAGNCGRDRNPIPYFFVGDDRAAKQEG